MGGGRNKNFMQIIHSLSISSTTIIHEPRMCHHVCTVCLTCLHVYAYSHLPIEKIQLHILHNHRSWPWGWLMADLNYNPTTLQSKLYRRNTDMPNCHKTQYIPRMNSPICGTSKIPVRRYPIKYDVYDRAVLHVHAVVVVWLRKVTVSAVYDRILSLALKMKWSSAVFSDASGHENELGSAVKWVLSRHEISLSKYTN